MMSGSEAWGKLARGREFGVSSRTCARVALGQSETIGNSGRARIDVG